MASGNVASRSASSARSSGIEQVVEARISVRRCSGCASAHSCASNPAEAVPEQVDTPEVERRAHLLDLADEAPDRPQRRVIGRLRLATAELVVEHDAQVVRRQVRERLEIGARDARAAVQAEQRARAGAVDAIGDLTPLDRHASVLDGLHRGTVPMWARDMRRGLRSRSACRISRSGRRATRATRCSARPTTNPERHFLGWLGEVDPEGLFASGAAWGICGRRAGRRPDRALTRSQRALVPSGSCPYR